MQDHAATRTSSPAGVVLLGLAVLTSVVQLYGLYRPEGPPTPQSFPWADKAGHLVIFALPVLMILLWRSVRTAARPTLRFIVAVIAIFAGHAVLSELIQAWLLPTRSGDPIDVVADLAGIAIGYGTAVLIISRRGGKT